MLLRKLEQGHCCQPREASGGAVTLRRAPLCHGVLEELGQERKVLSSEREAFQAR